MDNPLSRRTFLTAAAAAVSASASASESESASASAGPVSANTADRPPAGASAQALGGPVDVTVTVNRRTHRDRLDPRTTLLDYLRETLDLTGAKKGCNRGECGACTVHLDGRRVNGCMVLAASCDGRVVMTIEGLADADRLNPVQQAFLEHDGFQCGFCTPGQVMSAVACIAEGHAASDADIREWMSGNLCRCAAYPQIVAAVRAAAGRKA